MVLAGAGHGRAGAAMIDDNCHPFSLEGGTLDLEAFSLDAAADADADERRRRLGPGRLFQELLTARLAARLGCVPEEVPQARAEAAADWPAYVAALFEEAGIEAMVMDAYRHPSSDPGLVRKCADLAGRPAHAMLRIDPIVDEMIGRGASVSEIVAGVEGHMADAAAEGAVGFASVIAKRTGLAVDPEATPDEANRSLESVAEVRRRGKACRDLVLRRALAAAAALERPVLVHVGVDAGDLRLRDGDPTLLEDLLRTPEGAAVDVVLSHGAFPWTEQAAYMAATLPNVWLDLSLFSVYATATVEDRLLRALDLAPAGKLMAGTGAWGEPELFWFGAIVLQEAWGRVRARLQANGAREHWLERIERMLLGDNARTLFGLEA